jgi:hypothetical protein
MDLTRISLRKSVSFAAVSAAAALLALPASAQAPRGKAELAVSGGAITVDYGQPSLKGRDMLSQLEEGAFWRMGMNQATVLETPVDLDFGGTKVAKGSYSLWLKKQGEAFILVFNSQTGQWGTQHDPAKDVHSVTLESEALASPVETFTIELSKATGGGTLSLSWGATKLTGAFKIGM